MSRDGFVLVAVTGIALVTLSSFSSASATSLEVDGGVLQYAVLDGPPAPADPPTFAACGDNAQFDNVIVGSAAGETLHGTSGRDIIAGLGGDDVLYGDSQDDCILGGPGDDALHGENGQDLLIGGDGDDRIFGGNGQDMLHGGSGDDHLDGGNGPDQLLGGAGTNTCIDSNGPDSLTDCTSVTGSAAALTTPQPPASPAPSAAARDDGPSTVIGPPVPIPSTVTDAPIAVTLPSEASALGMDPAADQGDPRLVGTDTSRNRPHAAVGEQDESAEAVKAVEAEPDDDN
jgi:hypothetical protein